MKALSVKQPWASMIARGEKTIETRTWRTPHRSDLLIVASKTPTIGDLPTAGAVCVVKVIDCRLMTKKDETKACCELYPRAWAWVLDDIRPVKYFYVLGRQGLYEVEMS